MITKTPKRAIDAPIISNLSGVILSIPAPQQRHEYKYSTLSSLDSSKFAGCKVGITSVKYQDYCNYNCEFPSFSFS